MKLDLGLKSFFGWSSPIRCKIKSASNITPITDLLKFENFNVLHDPLYITTYNGNKILRRINPGFDLAPSSGNWLCSSPEPVQNFSFKDIRFSILSEFINFSPLDGLSMPWHMPFIGNVVWNQPRVAMGIFADISSDSSCSDFMSGKTASK